MMKISLYFMCFHFMSHVTPFRHLVRKIVNISTICLKLGMFIVLALVPKQPSLQFSNQHDEMGLTWDTK